MTYLQVINNMQGGVGATIHFHGMKMDKGYFWYDGVAGLTQCNIGYESSNTL